RQRHIIFRRPLSHLTVPLPDRVEKYATASQAARAHCHWQAQQCTSPHIRVLKEAVPGKRNSPRVNGSINRLKKFSSRHPMARPTSETSSVSRLSTEAYLPSNTSKTRKNTVSIK